MIISKNDVLTFLAAVASIINLLIQKDILVNQLIQWING